MDQSKPQYLTSNGFSRSGNGSKLGKRKPFIPVKSNKLSSTRLSNRLPVNKTFQLSEEAAKQIASVISKMLKS